MLIGRGADHQMPKDAIRQSWITGRTGNTPPCVLETHRTKELSLSLSPQRQPPLNHNMNLRRRSSGPDQGTGGQLKRHHSLIDEWWYCETKRTQRSQMQLQMKRRIQHRWVSARPRRSLNLGCGDETFDERPSYLKYSGFHWIYFSALEVFWSRWKRTETTPKQTQPYLWRGVKPQQASAQRIPNLNKDTWLSIEKAAVRFFDKILYCSM